MAPHGLYAYCAMLQAIADAKLAEADVSNDDTGLYAASGGSPHLLGHYLHRMNTMGVMRCSPLGIVASIAGTVNFNLVAAFQDQGRLHRLFVGLRVVLPRARLRLRRDRARPPEAHVRGRRRGRQRGEHPAVRRHAGAVAADQPRPGLAAVRRGARRLCRHGRGGRARAGKRGGGRAPRGQGLLRGGRLGAGLRRLQRRHFPSRRRRACAWRWTTRSAAPASTPRRSTT